MINVALGRPVIDAVLFSLAVAVGITPQLLPAVVSTSLATGLSTARGEEGARQAAGVHRGPRRHRRAVHRQDRHAHRRPHQLRTSDRRDRRRQTATCSPSDSCATKPPATGDTAVGGNPLDVALWEAPERGHCHDRRVPTEWRSPRSITTVVGSRCWPTTTGSGSSSPRALPRRSSTAAPTFPTGRARCSTPSSPAGNRVVAIATRRRAGAHGGDCRRRTRPDPRRVPRVPRPTQTVRRHLDRTARASSASPSRSSPATTPSSPRPCAAPSALTTGGTLTGTDLDALDEAQLAERSERSHDLRPGQPRAEGAHPAGPTRRRVGGRVPRRRRQRRPRPASRRRRDLGRLGDRRRQGRRRHHPARTRPRRARRRRRRGPPHLRQHHQVRADGHVVELREHVQRHRRRRVPPVPARCSRSRSCSTTFCTTPAR